MQDILKKASQIKLVIFDVDGVLTDGSLYLGDDGQEYKSFNSKDGHGMVMLQHSGTPIAIITGRTSEVVRIRMQSLGIEHVYQGRKDKVPAFFDLLEKTGLDASEIAYVGDDVIDLPVMTRVGLAIAVRDAHPLVQRHAHWVTPRDGGRGAARDVCEMIMEGKGQLDDALDYYIAKD